MPIVVTDTGIADARQAERGGFLVNLAEFSVSEATGFDVRADRSEPVGTQLYRAAIESIEAINRDSVKLTCTVPKGFPSTGQWDLGEVCIWNEAGGLFAHGAFTVFPKTDEFGLKFYVYVTLARLGDVINITTSDTMSLPGSASVSSLQPPETAQQNVVVVGDANSHNQEVIAGLPASSSSPAIAYKHGPGGKLWGFAGHSRVFAGKPSSLLDQSHFILDPGNNGFWLADDEIVVVQITGGSAQGQSRKMQYDSSSHRFSSVDKAFSGLSGTSTIAMWRSHEVALPKRHSGIPSYMVLGVGQNSYSSVVSSLSPSRLEPYAYAFVGNGGSTYDIPDTSLPLSRVPDANHLIIVIDGVTRPLNDYALSGNQLTINGGLAVDKRCFIWAFARATDNIGGVMKFQDSIYETTGANDYQLSTVPETNNNILVTDSSRKVYSPVDYSRVGSRLVFTELAKPPIGRKLTIVQGISASISDVRGVLTRMSFTAQTDTREINLSENIADKSNVALFIAGTWVERARYSVAGSKIKTMDEIVAGQQVELLVFSGLDTVSVTSRGGYDAGPAWIDPAGDEGTPNKLQTARRRYVAQGQASFAVESVVDQYHLMVFVNDKYLPQSEYLYDGTNIWPREVITGNATVEIICFVTRDHSGTSAHPQLSRLTSTGSNSVMIHPNADLGSLIVFVGERYVPSTAWTYNAQSGQLVFSSALAANMEVTAWSYRDQDEVGKQVRMYASSSVMTSNTRYLLKGALDEVQDMVLFSNGRSLSYSTFQLSNQNNFSYALFNNAQQALIGTTLNSVEFSTRTPRTRLVLRDELGGYLRKDLNFADVPDKALAKQNLGVIDPPPPQDLSGLLVKAMNLADVPDKAAARQNLGITDAISQLTQQVLLKPNNLADVPDKAAARQNLGITDIIAQMMQQVLLRGNNLSDVPDKAAARANLGIPNNAAIESIINFGNQSWRVKLGDLIIIGGKYRHPFQVGEVTVFIPFTNPFPSGCLNVIQSTWLPTPSMYFDGISQLCGTPSAGGFTIQVQTSDSNYRKWQGLDYIAIGW